MSVFSNNLLLGAGGQSTGPAPFDPTVIGNSVWLDGSADYLSKTPGSTGNQKRFTFAFWVQRNKFGEVAPGLYSAGDGTQNNDFNIYWNNSGGGGAAGDTLCISQITGGSAVWRIYTSQLFRDIGWYHFIISVDTAESTAADRVSIYLNGVQITSFASASYPSLNADVDYVNDSANEQRIGRNQGSNYIDGYLAQYLFLDGNSIQNGDVAVTDILDAFTFGTHGSEFAPKADADIVALASTAGGNSFCLDFSNSGSLGLDSANANNFTANNMLSVNQSTNTPSLAYPSLSNIIPASESSQGMSTLTNGNLSVAAQTGRFARSAMIVNSTFSKLYYEVTFDTVDATYDYPRVGIALTSYTGNDLWTPGALAGSGYGLQANTSTVQLNGSNLGTNAGFSSGNVCMVAFDPATGKIWTGKDGTYFNSGDPAAGSGEVATITGDEWKIFVGGVAVSGSAYSVNFGQSAFAHTVPTGFASLASSNLTAPTYQGIDYFTSTIYQGNGTGQRVGDFVPFTDSTTIANSIIFNDNDTAYLNRTFVTPTSANKFTFAFWMKCGSSTSDQYIFSTGTTNGTEAYIHLNHSTGGGQLWIADPNDGVGWGVKTDRKILDSSGWTHVCLSVDSIADSGSRFAIEINGVTATTTAFGAAEPSASQSLNFMTATAKNIGRRIRTSSAYFDGYLSDVYFIDGEKLAASNFGQLDTSTNRWVPKAYSGSYGNNGFKLAFGTAPGTGSGAGTDTSGEGHDWTENNFGTNDQVIDTPTKNFATLDPSYGYNNTTYTQGNLAVVGATVASQQNKSTYTTAFSQKSGKWWVEFDSILDAGGTTVFYGIIPTKYIRDGSFVAAAKDGSTGYADNLLGSIRAYIVGSTYGNKVYNISIGTGSGTTDLTSGGIIDNNAGGYTDLVPYGIALDMDNKKMWIGNPTISATTWNNETSVSPAANTGGFDLPFDEYSIFISNSQGTGFINFGQYVGDWNGNSVSDHTSTAGGNFTLAPPTDFKAINQDNLDDTASKITAWAWIKNRDAADDNIWMDRVIGTGGYLSTTQNDSGTAATAYGDGGSDILTTNTNAVQRFLQRGVQVGSDENVNTANESYVLWQWLLGDSATTGSSITTGSPSLATTGVVSDANHFSIVQYTGNGIDNATFAHGLGSTPNLVMIKRRSGTPTNSDWVIHIPGLGTENYIYPHYRIALSSGASSIGMVPDANLVEISTGVAINTSGQTHMAYSFKNTPGLCKIGTYVGNSSTDGAYVSTGFRPSWLWIFNTTLTSAAPSYDSERPIIDTARYRFNGATTAGGTNGGINFSDQRAAEEAQNTSLGVNPAIDILSDGFKLRANDSTINTATTYLYISMADIAGNGTLPPIYGR